MRFLGRIARIVVARQPLLVLRIGKAAPRPEVATRKLASLFGIVSHKREDILIIAVATLGAHSLVELEAIARIAKLLHHKRFAKTVAYLKMTVDILKRVVAGCRQIFDKAVGARPAPVIRPDMDVAIVDVLV